MFLFDNSSHDSRTKFFPNNAFDVWLRSPLSKTLSLFLFQICTQSFTRTKLQRPTHFMYRYTKCFSMFSACMRTQTIMNIYVLTNKSNTISLTISVSQTKNLWNLLRMSSLRTAFLERSTCQASSSGYLPQQSIKHFIIFPPLHLKNNNELITAP